MDNFSLRQLRYFAALARHGHFGRAAEACSISQPALSVQIRDLEAATGQVLFERGARQVRLTRFGEDFALRVRDVLRSVDELSEMARVAGSGLSGKLRLGVIPTIAPYLLPRVIARLTDAYPDLDLHVRETITPRLLDEIGEGRLDAAIVALPVSEPSLREVPLFDENLLLVRSAAERDAPVPRPDALQDMRLLLLEEGHCFRDQALSFCHLAQTRRGEGLDGSSLSTLVQMVGAGLGVTLIPEMAVPIETRSADVSLARFDDPQPGRTVGMVWRKSSPLSEDLSGLSKVVGEAATEAQPAA
jgi:LysR family hydrogen peroxide-inducible transcriptional activator